MKWLIQIVLFAAVLLFFGTVVLLEISLGGVN